MHNWSQKANALTSHEAYQKVGRVRAACCRYRGAFRRQPHPGAENSELAAKEPLEILV